MHGGWGPKVDMERTGWVCTKDGSSASGRLRGYNTVAGQAIVGQCDYGTDGRGTTVSPPTPPNATPCNKELDVRVTQLLSRLRSEGTDRNSASTIHEPLWGKERSHRTPQEGGGGEGTEEFAKMKICKFAKNAIMQICKIAE